MPSAVCTQTLQQAAARELYQRRQARRHLTDFTTYTYPQYTVDPVHRLIGDYLGQVVSGELKRLMIFAPPQHGKSELVSVRLPAFWLGNHPDQPVILSSYAASLAEDKGRQARDVVESEAFARLFPTVQTYRQSRAVQHWKINQRRGYMLSVGAGGPITGRGAMLGVIDDPVENWEHAQSERQRDKTWDWYRSTFRTRIWEGGAIVLIMTRWHEDDLAGRLLSDQADQWTVLRLPALAEDQQSRDTNDTYLGLPTGQPDPLGREPGAALSPRRFSQAALKAIKRDVGTGAWYAEYQGVPRTPGGNFFNRAWFKTIPAAPAQAARVRYWDNAATEGSGARTAGVLMSKTPAGLYVIEDVVKGQWSSGQRDVIMKQTADGDAAKYGNVVQIWFEEEGGSSGKDASRAIIQMMAGYPIHADRVTGDKVVRAGPFQAQAEAQNVRVVAGKWNREYLEELEGFPNGKFKDQVDATSGAFSKLPIVLTGKLFK